MNIVNISIYTEDEDGDNRYEETILITEESYNKMKYPIDEINILLGSVETSLYIEIYTYKELKGLEIDINNSGNKLYDLLCAIFSSHSLDLDEECERVEKYMDYFLDEYILLKMAVKKSKLKMIEDFIGNL